MKYYFIINPAAGQGGAAKMKQRIYETAKAKSIDFGIYTSKAPGDALVFSKLVCERPGQKTIFACGGDGTLCEVVNGVMQAEAEKGDCGAAVGCIPCGTGNDFVRNFPEAGDFTDIGAQISGSVKRCDLIRYDAEAPEGGTAGSGYCINMFNIGFDANVVDMTGSMKKLPLVSGPFAYILSAGAMLIRKKGADLRVLFDDGEVFDGKLFMIAAANGCYCGGGVKGIAKAEVDDGLMDVSLVKYVSRKDFIKLFPLYKEGTHLEDERAAKLVIYKHSKSLTIEPNGGKMRLCADGEMMTTGAVRFWICEQALDFVLPEA